jgi:hypothetical protein
MFLYQFACTPHSRLDARGAGTLELHSGWMLHDDENL